MSLLELLTLSEESEDSNEIDWNIVKSIVNNDNSSVKEKNEKGYLPLHLACENNAPRDVIKLLLELYHDAIKEKGRNGFLPLHCACFRGSNIDAIKLLIEAYPDSVREKSDQEQTLPLNYAFFWESYY